MTKVGLIPKGAKQKVGIKKVVPPGITFFIL